MFFNEYPYRNLNDFNLDYLLKSLRTLSERLENFVSLNTIKYANPIQWNITRQYETNTVVIDPLTGTAFLSVKPVPSGVALNNEEYWTTIFTLDLLNANQNLTLRNDSSNIVATFDSVVGDWLIWNNILYKVIRNIDTATAYVVGYNLERYTIEMFLKDYIADVNNKIGNLQDLTTTDKTNIVNSINSLVTALNNEINTRSTADSAINQRIDNEVSARTSADVLINQRIDAIVSANKGIVNVKDYGLTGDGVTNEGAAFRQLLIDKPHCTYYFPKGTYKFTGNTFGGDISLLGVGDATIVDFTYEEMHMPALNAETDFNIDNAFFEARNLQFTSSEQHYSLDIHVQSQGTVLRTFQISDCLFYGRRGVRLRNAISGNIESCDFTKNQTGIRSESSTNINISNCNFYSPIYGVIIRESSDDSANRKGGESLHFNNCMWIDGVTAIWASHHNYLELSECMIDYMNVGIYLRSSRYARICNTWIGSDAKDRSFMAGYDSPNLNSCIDAEYDNDGYTSSVEAINSEFWGYGSTNFINVILRGGSLQGGVEDSEFVNCRFGCDSTGRMETLFYASKCNDLRLESNNFYAPANDNLQHPYIIDDSVRTVINRNMYANCFKSNNTTIMPKPANNPLNNMFNFEAKTVTVTADGAGPSYQFTYNFANQYEAVPTCIATIGYGTEFYRVVCSIASITATSAEIVIFRPDGTSISGNYKVHIIVMASDG
jgi:hypothetical protein